MKDKKSPELKKEIDAINHLKRKHGEVREFTTMLISKLKSEAEGRGKVSEVELGRLRKMFKVMVDSLEEE